MTTTNFKRDAYKIYGLSTDTKPSGSPYYSEINSHIIFEEIDTGNTYLWQGSSWVQCGPKFIQNKMRVSSVPYLYDVAEGNVFGHSGFEKFAVNDDIDSANEEDIWCVGGSYVWPAAEQQMEVVSSSVEDDPVKADLSVGTGIHSIRIYYLNASWEEKTEDVTLDGTTVVPTVATDIYRINRLRPLTVGTGLKAAGNIDVRNLANTPIYSRIATGFTKGRQIVYTVPADKVFYLVSMAGSCGGTTAPKYGKFVIRSTYDNIGLMLNAWLTAYAETGVSSNYFNKDFPAPLKFPEGSDIIMSCKTLDDNCYVTGSIRGWTEDA